MLSGVEMNNEETAYWKRYQFDKDNPNSVRVSNQQYWIGPAHISTPINGHKGRWFTIEFLDGRKVRTCDLWYQGPIPPELRESLADNARFVEE